MGSNDRFYQLELRNRPAMHGDVGSLLKIEGLVLGGSGAGVIMLLPAAEEMDRPTVKLTEEQWTDWLQRSDQPEILVGPAKAFHRKVRHEISGAVQQKIWMADNLQCRFCHAPMGKVQLTIDHFVPLELGGKNDTSNYISACRRCNKDKGSEDPRDFCKRRNLSYDNFVEYLAKRQITS